MRVVDPVSSREALTGTEDLGFRGGRAADNVDPIFTANDKITPDDEQPGSHPSPRRRFVSIGWGNLGQTT
jgi:hypothetical protein